MDKETIKSAIEKAIASRGKNKGKLKAKCPPINTPGAAAWQAIQLNANPYKVGVCHLFFMDKDNLSIYGSIAQAIKKGNIDVRSLDADRLALESIGAW